MTKLSPREASGPLPGPKAREAAAAKRVSNRLVTVDRDGTAPRTGEATLGLLMDGRDAESEIARLRTRLGMNRTQSSWRRPVGLALLATLSLGAVAILVYASQDSPLATTGWAQMTTLIGSR